MRSQGLPPGRIADIPPSVPGLVGTSRAMERVRQLVDLAASSDAPVLLRGEPGTGKELVARTIHSSSPRKAGPFVAIQPGTWSERRIEGELSGETRGGTLYLERVEQLALPLQGKLLLALETAAVERPGGWRLRRAGCRVMASSEADLEGAVSEGRFTRRLLALLSALEVRVPPLRERPTDITLLVHHFLELHAREEGTEVRRISASALELLTTYHWPGNVRELEDSLSRALRLAHGGVVRGRDLPAALQTGRSTGTSLRGSLASLMMAYEREILMEALREAGGNQSRAARALSTTVRILSYRLRKHGLRGHGHGNE